MNLLVGLSAIIFVVGIWAPILTLKKLVIVKNTFSVLSGITQLAADGQYGLFIIIAVFTLLLPAVKFALLFQVINKHSHSTVKKRYVSWMATIGKWSMLDVFVVAVLIASVKLGAIATINVHYGLYVFAAAVISLMICTQLVQRELRTDPADVQS